MGNCWWLWYWANFCSYQDFFLFFFGFIFCSYLKKEGIDVFFPFLSPSTSKINLGRRKNNKTKIRALWNRKQNKTVKRNNIKIDILVKIKNMPSPKDCWKQKWCPKLGQKIPRASPQATCPLLTLVGLHDLLSLLSLALPLQGWPGATDMHF